MWWCCSSTVCWSKPPPLIITYALPSFWLWSTLLSLTLFWTPAPSPAWSGFFWRRTLSPSSCASCRCSPITPGLWQADRTMLPPAAPLCQHAVERVLHCACGLVLCTGPQAILSRYNYLAVFLQVCHSVQPVSTSETTCRCFVVPATTTCCSGLCSRLHSACLIGISVSKVKPPHVMKHVKYECIWNFVSIYTLHVFWINNCDKFNSKFKEFESEFKTQIQSDRKTI